MTITREQVADLCNQDVVRLTNPVIPGLSVEGKLYEVEGVLGLCSWMTLRRKDGEPGQNWLGWDLTVVSRAPRPLYVNSERTEPAERDVVRDVDGDAWQFERGEWWCASPDAFGDDSGSPIDDFRPLTLLWDGQTGRAVQ